MDVNVLRALARAISDAVADPGGSWREKAVLIRGEVDAADFEEFLSWFEDEDPLSGLDGADPGVQMRGPR